jgi:hypothetical protein
MGFLAALAAVAAVLAVFDLFAERFGADSREGFAPR